MSYVVSIDKKQALRGLESRKFSGKYNAIITEAIVSKTTGGYNTLALKVRIPERDKEYEIQKIFFAYEGSNKLNQNQQKMVDEGMGHLASLIQFTGAEPRVDKLATEVYNYESKMRERKDVDQFVELVGKDIGLLIKLKKEFPQKKEGDKYIKDYSRDRRLNFYIVKVFDPETGMTLVELEKGAKKATEIDKAAKGITDWEESVKESTASKPEEEEIPFA